MEVATPRLGLFRISRDLDRIKLVYLPCAVYPTSLRLLPGSPPCSSSPVVRISRGLVGRGRLWVRRFTWDRTTRETLNVVIELVYEPLRRRKSFIR